MQSIFGGSVVRWFGVSADSMKNNGVLDTHNFSWKLGLLGGIL